MRIRDLLAKESIMLNGSPKSKDDAIRQMAELMAKSGKINDKQAYIDGLFKREEESTTGMMDGFAIPHAKDHSIEEANVIIVQLNSKIDWKSLDGEGTDFIIALFIPDIHTGSFLVISRFFNHLRTNFIKSFI